MKIQFHFFAELRDRFGTDGQEIELEPGTTVQEAIRQWEKMSGFAVPAGLPVRIAVNEQFADSGRPLASGDRVALLTPFSGG
jgi:molybdopterin converting factor small subunit